MRDNIYYNKDGKIIAKGKSHKRVLVGKWIYYVYDGPIMVNVETYNFKNGIKDGPYYRSHLGGYTRGKFKNNYKSGNWKFYDHKGQLIEEKKYRKGELIKKSKI